MRAIALVSQVQGTQTNPRAMDGSGAELLFVVPPPQSWLGFLLSLKSERRHQPATASNCFTKIYFGMNKYAQNKIS